MHLATPHGTRQLLDDELGFFLLLHWEDQGLGLTFPAVGVKRPRTPNAPELRGGVPRDFRIPDRAFVVEGRHERLQKGWIVGPPDVVLEIPGPDDARLEKLPWYFDLGVREVILIHRDTRDVDVRRRGPTGFDSVTPDADGWVRSDVLRTELRREPGNAGAALALRRSDEPTRAQRIDM